VTVHNQGAGGSAATTVRFYRSTDATITTSDTLEGTGAVNTLVPSGGSGETILLTAPATAGTYYYGACVDVVPKGVRHHQQLLHVCTGHRTEAGRGAGTGLGGGSTLGDQLRAGRRCDVHSVRDGDQ